MRAIFSVAAGFIVAAALFAGCGGGGDDSAAMTKSEFIVQGDKICRETTQRKNADLQKAIVRHIKVEGNPRFSAADKEELMTDVALPPVAEMTSELEALEAPDEAEAAAVVKAFRTTVTKLEANPEEGFELNPFTPADRKAAAYGFKFCSRI